MLAEMLLTRLGAPIRRFLHVLRFKNFIGKMVGKPLGWGPLKNKPLIYTSYMVGIYWGPYPLLKGSNRGVKQLGALHPKGLPFSL